MQNKKFGTIIGTFSKGIKGSISINFTPSGSKHCSDECPLKGVVCYAETTEKMKPTITKNLSRKADDFSGYLKTLVQPKALKKIGESVWLRFSTFGTIPAPGSWSHSDKEMLKTLAMNSPSDRTHFPVETLEKARALMKLGMPGVRYSATNSEEKMYAALSEGVKASITVDCGKRARGKNKREISGPAFLRASDLRKKGLNAKVCPAIVGSGKCGSCKMCASKNVDVVIYPLH